MAGRVLLPPGWATPVGYANGIEAPVGRTIFVAGQIGWDASGKFANDDLAPQFERTLMNITAVLAQAGAEPRHICRMTAFCTDKPAYVAARNDLGRIWRQVMGKHYPAMSLVFVAALLEDRAKIEIEATAVVPA
ncbi:MAG: RidA family protein [Proteobacteria bacterium]|nr:RidA family protein [Pseudomonadota bacterium]